MQALTSDNFFSVEYGGSPDTLNRVAGSIVLGKPSDMTFDPQVSSFTVLGWFKRFEAADSQRCIISKAYMDPGSGGDITLFIGVDGSDQLYVLCGGGENTAGGTIDPAEWNMFAFTCSGGNGRLYLNGVQVGTTFSVGVASNTGADWVVGSSRYTDNTDTSYEFRGAIQNIGVWATQALSGQQITEVYGTGVPMDISTGATGANLSHWWIRGDVSSINTWPVLLDTKGSDDGTVQFTPGIKIAEYSPVHVAAALDTFDGTDPDNVWMFDATDYAGTGNWAATAGSFTGVADTGSNPTKAATTPFTGHHDITMTRLFIMAASAANTVGASFIGTFLFRIYTGALDGSGGFFAGYDGSGLAESGANFYQLYYSEDFSFRLRDGNNLGDSTAVESHTSRHPNKYIECVVTIDMTQPRFRVFVNGSMLIESTALGGGFTAPALNVPFGLCGMASVTGGGALSGASGSRLMQAQLLSREMPVSEVMASARKFNALKGYI